MIRTINRPNKSNHSPLFPRRGGQGGERLFLFLLLLLPFLITSCLDEEVPTDYAAGSQVEKSSEALDGLLYGLSGAMVEYDTYSSSESTALDWGYPGQMVIRDVLCEDFPVGYSNASSYDYYSYIADGTSLLYHPIYTFYYYSKLVFSANNLIAKGGGATTTTNKTHVGMGLAFRALCYLDLARMFECKKTGFDAYDSKATSVWGLTVPIVTDTLSVKAARNNPRAPFYTMYRFINNDLSNAETLLTGYTRTDKSLPDLSVVYGLKARLWLEMATRFEKNADDLATQLSHEDDADGYAKLGITSALDCYTRAADYAQRAMEGYKPTERKDWYNTKTGFNTETSSWMWKAAVGDKEQLNSYYYSWIGTLNSEANFTLANYGTYRCIGAKLFNEIPQADWRKRTWVNPTDSARLTETSYVEADSNAYVTLLDSTKLASVPDYTNFKFHPGSGNLDDYQECLLCDIPLMRMEEMEYIYVEAIAHTQGAAAAAAELQSFTNEYRYNDGSYVCTATTVEALTEEVIRQKRIELWGEGLVYFDYKRLGLAIQRTYTGTNFPEDQRLNSKEGYAAPWLNYAIPQYERYYNPAVVLSPDPSGVVTAQ